MNEINEVDESTEEAHFRKHIFFVVLDNVIGELTVRFSAAKQISDTFKFVWNYQKMSKEELKCKAAKLAETYSQETVITRRVCAGNQTHNNGSQCSGRVSIHNFFVHV